MSPRRRQVSEIDAVSIELDSDVRRNINKRYKEQMKVWAPQLVESDASPATKGLMVMLSEIWERKPKPKKKPKRSKGQRGGYGVYDARVLRRFGEWMQTLQVTEPYAQAVESLVETGVYSSQGEALRAAIRLLLKEHEES